MDKMNELIQSIEMLKEDVDNCLRRWVKSNRRDKVDAYEFIATYNELLGLLDLLMVYDYKEWTKRVPYNYSTIETEYNLATDYLVNE